MIGNKCDLFWVPIKLSYAPYRMCVCLLSHSVVSDSLWSHGLQTVRVLCPWDFWGKNTGGVAISSSRGSSQPRIKQAFSVSLAVAGRFFTIESLGSPPYRGDIPRYLLAKETNGSNLFLYILPHCHWKTSMENFETLAQLYIWIVLLL